MILVVGGTGSLGSRVVASLRAEGRPVRVMTRDPARAATLAAAGAEVVRGDLRDAASLRRACTGVEAVVSGAHGFDGRDGNSPARVDDRGNADLLAAAAGAGVRHVVLVSAVGAGPGNPVDLFRCKHAAEEALRASGLGFAIVRATAFMEFWAAMVGTPILRTGKVTLFGRGRNPVNFVSVDDVAAFVRLALDDPRLAGRTVAVGGPEDLAFTEVADLFDGLAGRPSRRSHVPLPLMRFLSVALRPVHPGLARQIGAGVYMDTADLRFSMREEVVPPGWSPTPLAEVAARLAASERSRA